MATRRDQTDSRDFIAADEIDELFGAANPNVDRIGCPTRATLSALARRERPIGDPGYEHLAGCSPCYREFRVLQDAVRMEAGRRVTSRMKWVAVVAAVALLALTGGWLYFSSRGGIEPPPPVVAELQVGLDLRPYAVPRSPQDPQVRPPLDLPRGLLRVTLLLPAGSEPGSYDLQLLDSASRPQASASGSAEIRNFVTTIEARIDLRATPAGAYQLAVRRLGEDWHLYPARVR